MYKNYGDHFQEFLGESRNYDSVYKFNQNWLQSDLLVYNTYHPFVRDANNTARYLSSPRFEMFRDGEEYVINDFPQQKAVGKFFKFKLEGSTNDLRVDCWVCTSHKEDKIKRAYRPITDFKTHENYYNELSKNDYVNSTLDSVKTNEDNNLGVSFGHPIIKPSKSHRKYTYELVHGEDLQVHEYGLKKNFCGNKKCCNPFHTIKKPSEKWHVDNVKEHQQLRLEMSEEVKRILKETKHMKLSEFMKYIESYK